jgi:hypothetical protein
MFILKITHGEDPTFFQQDSTCTGLGVIAAILTLFAVSVGYRFVLALVTTAGTLCVTGALVGPMMSISGMTILLLGFHVSSNLLPSLAEAHITNAMVGHCNYNNCDCHKYCQVFLPNGSECTVEVS